MTQYRISSITDNGNEVSALATLNADGTYHYVINNVQSDHQIIVHFEWIPIYTVSAYTSGDLWMYGGVSPASQICEPGSNALIKITVQTQYRIAAIYDYNVKLPDSAIPTTLDPDGTYHYVINNVQSDHQIIVHFEWIPIYTVTARRAGTYWDCGEVTPINQTCEAGSQVAIKITPNTQYRIFSITDNTIDVTNSVTLNGDGSYNYIITNVYEDHIVDVEFAYNQEDGDGMKQYLDFNTVCLSKNVIKNNLEIIQTSIRNIKDSVYIYKMINLIKLISFIKNYKSVL